MWKVTTICFSTHDKGPTLDVNVHEQHAEPFVCEQFDIVSVLLLCLIVLFFGTTFVYVPTQGNSGGPAFCDMANGRVAGVAFSSLSIAGTVPELANTNTLVWSSLFKSLKCLYTALSHIPRPELIGFIIPSVVIQHFMHEYTTFGVFRGNGSVGFRCQDLENPQLREFFNVCLQHARQHFISQHNTDARGQVGCVDQ